MISIVGTYQNGHLTLDRDYSTKKPVKVIVTFLEDVQASSDTRLSLNDFSFLNSRKNLENVKETFSDIVLEERRIDL